MTDRYQPFNDAFAALVADLTAAKAAIADAGRAMEADPTDATIAAYEDALNRADMVRAAMGENQTAHMRQRDLDSGRIAA